MWTLVKLGATAALGSLLIYRTLRRRRSQQSKDSCADRRDLSGAITFLYSRNFVESRKFYEEDLGLCVRSDKGAVVFYELPGSASSLGVVHGLGPI